MKRLIVVLTVCAIAIGIHAQVPAGYYNSLDGKSGAELKTAVCNVIKNFSIPGSYATVYSNLPQSFQRTDVYPDSRRWWDMYSDIPFYAPSFSGLNREHSFPKSWWGGLTNIPAYVDLNHLYPSEMKANSAKLNYPLGEVDMKYKLDFDNGITKVGYPVAGQGGGAKYVFEPDDEYKGDFARTYFYMVTCYQDLKWSYTFMMNQNTYPTLNDWSVKLLLKWSRADIVSQKEIDRNEQVYTIQNNRNPFIDFPQLAEYIWGNKVGEPFYLKDQGSNVVEEGKPELFSPVNGMALDFGQVAVGSSVDAILYFKGESLTKNLSARVFSDNSEFFTVPTNSIPYGPVNSANGYSLKVTYRPTTLGEHKSKIVVYDGGLSYQIGIDLRGECLEVPTLNACTALPATDITDDCYTANWTTPDDVVDYYVVTVTHYVNGKATAEELLAESNSLVIDGFDKVDSDSYSVRSVRLGHTSPESNVIFVDHTGIEGVANDEPLAVYPMEGAIRLICSRPQTGCHIYDVSGREIRAIDVVDCNIDIEMPVGIYFVTTDQCRRPVKVTVR